LIRLKSIYGENIILKHVVFVYPVLTSYILPVLYNIAQSGRLSLDIIYGKTPSGEGLGEHLPFTHPNAHWIQVEARSSFGEKIGIHQKGILGYLIKTRPDAVWIGANPRSISFWGVLIVGRLLGIQVYARGHGLFKKEHVGIHYRLMYKIILLLSQTYVCYTPLVQKSLMPLIKDHKKLVVDFNTMHNQYPVSPEEKTGKEGGIFYIGRVRSGCGVNVLIETVLHLNQKYNLGIELHIIGDGPLGSYIRQQTQKYPWLHYYGEVYDQKLISEISRSCRLGCVPGFMGLNVVHMMSLSLPVLTHRQLPQHVGPEPEYIQDKINGWFIENPNDGALLAAALKELWQTPGEKINLIQANAYQTYGKLNIPPFHERLLQILGA